MDSTLNLAKVKIQLASWKRRTQAFSEFSHVTSFSKTTASSLLELPHIDPCQKLHPTCTCTSLDIQDIQKNPKLFSLSNTQTLPNPNLSSLIITFLSSKFPSSALPAKLKTFHLETTATVARHSHSVKLIIKHSMCHNGCKYSFVGGHDIEIRDAQYMGLESQLPLWYHPWLLATCKWFHTNERCKL